MSQTICFDVVCLENVLLRHAFSGPQPLVRGSILTRNVYFGTTMPSGSFPHFYTKWLSEENCQVSALYLISVKFGVRFKMAKSPICLVIAQS